jgi:chromosome segregation ATPase
MSTSLSPHQSEKKKNKNKEDVQPVADKIAELNESQTELLGRIRGLKECLHSWRVKLDTQVKTYQDELSDLKKALSSEMEQLTLDFSRIENYTSEATGRCSSQPTELGYYLRSIAVADPNSLTIIISIL